jgi:uncharacterized protein (TIGR00251 family)
MYLEEREGGVILTVKVIPGSSRNALTEGAGDRLVIKLTSPPVEGKANKQLIKFLGKRLGVSPSSISILRGAGSREKILFITGADGETVRKKIELESK